jgi:hypothetical protein
VKPGHVPNCCKGSKNPHPACNEELCVRCPVCAEHAVFNAAADRRRANGIRLGRLQFMVDPTQVEAFEGIYQTWVRRWGKETAVDAVITSMCDAEARYQDTKRLMELMEELKRQKRKRKRA